MMIRKILGTFIIFTLFSGIVTAQDPVLRQAAVLDVTPKASIWNNMFIEIAGGSQMLFSADAENLDFKERLTPQVALSLGRWFSPVFGVSVKAEGCSLNGFSTTEGEYTAADESSLPFDRDPVRKEVTINPDGTYRHFIRYINLSLNLSLSLTDLIMGYDDHSVFSLVTSAGIGNMHVFGYKGIPRKNSLSGNANLTLKFHLSPLVELNLNGSATAFPNQFEGRMAGTRDYENYLTANVGLVYNLAGRRFAGSRTPTSANPSK